MKAFILSLASMLLLLGTSTRGFGQNLKVLTYNIRYDAESDGEDNWHNRKMDFVSYVVEKSPDFLCVQEALHHQSEYIAEHLPGYQHFGVGRDDGQTAGEFMTVFFKTEHWDLHENHTFWLSSTPDVPSRGWDAACHRVATYGIFKHKQSGKSICLTNTHFDHQGPEARNNSVLQIRQFLEKQSEKYPVILCGDFNFEPMDALYGLLAHDWKDTRVYAQNRYEESYGTFNGFEMDDDYPRRIDYIFADRSSFEILDYRMEHPKTSNERQLSDHFPVLAELKIK